MTDIPSGIVPVSSTEYDELYPKYEQALRDGKIHQDMTFQE